MNKLLDFLNSSFSKDLSSLEKTFIDTYGVNVKQEGNLYQFKYSMLDAKWDYDITHECRGVIMEYDPTSQCWKYVARPFNKFFNQSEGRCLIFKKDVFESNIEKLYVNEKADGTCIIVYKHNDVWKVSTLGTITPLNVYDYQYTFSQLFIDTVGGQSMFDEWTNTLNGEYTFIFELCTNMNRIVTRYKNDHVCLLGIRHSDTGEYCSTDVLNSLSDTWKNFGINVRRPYQFTFYDRQLNTLEDVEAYVDASCDMYVDRGIEYFEGYVVYMDGFPIAKMKSKKYVHLHSSIGGGDPLHSRNVVLDSIFSGTIDDVYNVINDLLKKFVENVKRKIHTVKTSVFDGIEIINKSTYATQKEYALSVQKNVHDRRFHAFFYAHKQQILASTSDGIEVFDTWLKNNYKNFIDYWKDDNK